MLRHAPWLCAARANSTNRRLVLRMAPRVRTIEAQVGNVGDLPCKCNSCREKGRKAVQSGKERVKCRDKKGVYGIDDGDIEDIGNVEHADDFGDLDICAVEEAWGAYSGQSSASAASDPPPRLIGIKSLGGISRASFRTGTPS